MQKEYEIEANITLCSQVEASNKKEAIDLAIEDITIDLAIEDITEGIYDTEIFPEDCKIISTRKI